MSQVNHNFSYAVATDGLTVWEKLRSIRNFLEDRRIAYKLAELNQRKHLARIARFEATGAGEDSEEYWEIEEAKLYNDQLASNVDDCAREIEFLEQFEAKLALEAEKTRVPGKSDKDMYEINYVEELTLIQVTKAQGEALATGHISPDSMLALMRNPNAAAKAVQVGLLPPQALHDFALLGGSTEAVIRETMKLALPDAPMIEISFVENTDEVESPV
jgi:hypothetical protein